MFNFITTATIGFIAFIQSVLFAPLGEYVVTTTTYDPNGTWTDTRRTMNQKQLNRFIARIRPDLEVIELSVGVTTGLCTDGYETLHFIERKND